MNTHAISMSLDSEREVLIDQVHGIHIPQMFAKNYGRFFPSIHPMDLLTLEKGPENEMYWEAWEDVLANTKFIDHLGREWTLEHDQDLFLVRMSDDL